MISLTILKYQDLLTIKHVLTYFKVLTCLIITIHIIILYKFEYFIQENVDILRMEYCKFYDFFYWDYGHH